MSKSSITANAKSGQNLQSEATPLKIWQKNVMFEPDIRTRIRKGEHCMEIIICDDNLILRHSYPLKPARGRPKTVLSPVKP